MPQFMVVFELPEPFPEEFIALIPEQRVHIDELVQNGIIQSYSLSLDRTSLWCVVNSETELHVVETIHEFPLIDYMDYEICELMFTTTTIAKIPAFSLN